MSNLKIFNYKDKKIRTFLHLGDVFWVLDDVTRALDNKDKAESFFDESLVTYLNGSEYIDKHTYLATGCVTTQSLYNFIRHYSCEEFRLFQKWLEETIPSVYGSHDVIIPGKYLNFPRYGNEEYIEFLRNQIEKLEESIAVLKLKAKAFDKLVEENLLTDFQEMNKLAKGDALKYLFKNGFLHAFGEDDVRIDTQKNDDLLVKKDHNIYLTPKGVETFKLFMKGGK